MLAYTNRLGAAVSLIWRSFSFVSGCLLAIVVCSGLYGSNVSAHVLASSRANSWTNLWVSSRVDSEADLESVPQFSSDPDRVVHEGYFDLQWKLPSGAVDESVAKWQFALEMANHSSFSNAKVVYSGGDQGTYFSGLKDGDYFFRVRARLKSSPWSGWSPIHRVQVEHHPLRLAWWLFAAGAVIFSSICIFLIRVVNRTGES